MRRALFGSADCGYLATLRVSLKLMQLAKYLHKGADELEEAMGACSRKLAVVISLP